MPLLTIRKLLSNMHQSEQYDVKNPTHIGETEIFRNRLILGSLVLILGYFFKDNIQIVIAFAVYLGLACLLWITQIKSLLPTNARLGLGLFMESGMGFYLLSLDSAGLAFIYPIYLWTILGNGFRFGLKWLTLASLCIVTSFSLTIYTEAFWQQNLPLSIGLLLALIIIPLYCASLIRKLSQAKEKAETANRAKSYFLASVSHELRTPLNAIIGYGSHLSSMNLSPSQLKMVNSSVSAGQYLLQLIEQLLQLGKSDTQDDVIEMIDFNVTDVLMESRDMLNVRAQEKGLELLLQSEAACHQQFNGPVKAIKNLVLNITSNAIKFTDHGKIIIRSSIENTNGKLSLILSINDTGIGIDKDNCNDIFKPFQQADSSISERFGGTGLGLAICKQIIDSLNGSISVESELGQGSVFKLSIPIQKAKSSEDIEEIASDIVCTKIISLGKEKEETLLQAQCSGEYFINHYDCDSPEAITREIGKIDLNNYDIVILDQSIVGDIDSCDPFWQHFTNSMTACILISDDEEFDIHKINIQTAFDSILSPVASFDQFRQAIKIGTAFVDKSASYAIDEDVDCDHQNHINNNKNILVVDDNRTNRLVLESILLSDGYNVSLVNDGDEALQILEEQSFDIMLIDVNMPRLNGIEATKLWRHIEAPNRHLPIIGVTADATEETLEKCISAGMNERMTKPIEAKKLLAKVREYCDSGNNSHNEDQANAPSSNVIAISDIDIDKNIIDISRIDYLESIGNRDFVRLVIDSYVDETHEMSEQLHNEGHLCGCEKFRFIAHAIKSSANNVGATQLSTMCKQYESISENEYLGNENMHIEALLQSLRQVENNIDILKSHYGEIEKNNDLGQAAII